MNKKIEDNLKSVKIKPLSEEEKNRIWSRIILTKERDVLPNRSLLVFIFKQHMIPVLISLLVILGGGGVVAASNQAVPGDFLFGVDKVVEKMELGLASQEKKNELKVKFASERLAEASKVITQSGSQVARDSDLSESNVTEIEVDVFDNETTVKIEADDKHYGFVTTEKDKEKIIDEIALKYNLTEANINAILDFEVEDRDSRADDKGFVNSSNSLKFKSEKQEKEIKASLDSVADVLADANIPEEKKEAISATLAGIITLLEDNPNLEIEIKTKDGFKLEVEDGEIEIKLNSGKSGAIPNSANGTDIRESEDEVFCRGEWRDPEDCSKDSDDDSDDSSDDDDDDNDDSSSGDSDDDDEEDDEDDNSDQGGDDDSDDDNDDESDDDEDDNDN